MFQIKRSIHAILWVAAATCITLPGMTLAVGDGNSWGDLTVEKVFAVDSFGVVDTLRIVGESFDAGELTGVTLGGAPLEIERANGSEIFVALPDDLEPGYYELAIAVRDEVTRLDQAVAIEIPLAPSKSMFDDEYRGMIWSSAHGPLGADPEGEAKALAAYQRTAFSGPRCPHNFFCMRRRGCARGLLVVGGGMFVSGNTGTDAVLVESFPSSTRAWEARILNQSGGSKRVTTYAICVR